MLNKEKYAKEIIEVVVNSGGQGVGVKDCKPFPCRSMDCEDCDFASAACYKGFMEWANSEYVEPTVDWNKVPVDTPILVRDCDSENWYHRYFAKFVNGQVYAWSDGGTSWSVNTATPWRQTKLAESEGEA